MATQIDPGAIIGKLTENYMKLPILQKIVIPLLILGSSMGIVYVSKWANQPEYVTLFSDLEPVDSASVIERLKDMKISYDVRGGGSVIAVSPPEAVHELRMTLAGEGIPKGGVVGLEIFEAAELGSTTFQEKVKFMRAIQGELERTIVSLDAVSAARVHIAQPEKSVFANRGNKTTASVMLRLTTRDGLTKKQLKGITQLVAGSVEGLASADVSILDSRGTLLTSPEGENEETMEAEATRLAYKREIEKGYTRTIEQMLTKVLGQGKAIARVTADVDFTQSEREEESFDPGGQVLRSERLINEGLSEAQRGGIPGVVSNLGPDTQQNILGTPGSGGKARNESVRNYEVSRAVSKTRSPQGALEKLSVAVIVDGDYEMLAPAEGEKKQRTFIPLSDEKMQRIESVVKSAVGYDASRGDTVTVENIAFSEPPVDLVEQLDAKATQDMIFNVIFRTGPILFLILFFFIVVRPLVKFLITPTDAELDLERLLPTGIKELEQELEAEKSRANVPSFEPAIDLDQLEELMSENSRIVQENPQQAALLIRYWLNDGRL